MLISCNCDRLECLKNPSIRNFSQLGRLCLVELLVTFFFFINVYFEFNYYLDSVRKYSFKRVNNWECSEQIKTEEKENEPKVHASWM